MHHTQCVFIYSNRIAAARDEHCSRIMAKPQNVRGVYATTYIKRVSRTAANALLMCDRRLFEK